MTCVICCEPFTKITRSKFICPLGACQFESCSKCIKTYIESNLNAPHCMSCKYEYDDLVIMNEINYTFYNTQYQSKMTDIVMNLERSLIASTIDEARQYKLRYDAQKILDQLTIEKNDIIAEMIYCEKFPSAPHLLRLCILNKLLTQNTKASVKPKAILLDTTIKQKKVEKSIKLIPT